MLRNEAVRVIHSGTEGLVSYNASERSGPVVQLVYDANPGLYCCVHPTCSHPRDQVFNGGGGYDIPLRDGVDRVSC